jgi:hypothetical protein
MGGRMLTDRRTEELLEKKEALDRLRKNLYHLWKTLKEAREDPTLPGRWSRAPEGSQEWRKAKQHAQALEVLRVSLSERPSRDRGNSLDCTGRQERS